MSGAIRLKFLTVLFGVFLVSFNTIFAANGALSNFTCDVLARMQGGTSMSMKILVKGNKFRMEGVMQGIQSITIFDGKSAFMYMPKQNMAMPVPLSQEDLNMMPSTWDISSQCSYLGSENVDGIPCKTYNCGKAKVWASQENDFPVKVISQGVEIRYSNLKQNNSLDDSLFILPAGVNIMDMGNAMQGLYKGLER